MSGPDLVVLDNLEGVASVKTNNGEFVQRSCPEPPEIRSMDDSFAYKSIASNTFVNFPDMLRPELVICNNFLLYDDRNLLSWAVEGKVRRESMKRCTKDGWFNDELIDYCLSNVNTLFGGDLSKHTTFVFPTKFLTRFRNIGHSTLEGQLDWECVIRMTRRLVHRRNLFLYDHVIMVANPGSMHWNCVVIYPKLKRIESVDSLSSSSTEDLHAAWHWMVWYCAEYDVGFNPVEWNLYCSGSKMVQQHDTFNCGPFTILNTVCIHHRYSRSKVTARHCGLLRLRLLFHLLNYNGPGQRLCEQWTRDYPLVHLAAKGSNTKPTTRSAARHNNVAQSGHRQNRARANRVSQDLTQHSAGGNDDDDPPKKPKDVSDCPIDDTPIKHLAKVQIDDSNGDEDLKDILTDETFENIDEDLKEFGIPVDDPSLIMGVRMDELPSTQDDQTFDELQDELKDNSFYPDEPLSNENRELMRMKTLSPPLSSQSKTDKALLNTADSNLEPLQVPELENSQKDEEEITPKVPSHLPKRTGKIGKQPRKEVIEQIKKQKRDRQKRKLDKSPRTDTTDVSGKKLRRSDKRRLPISDTANDSDTEEEHYPDEDLPDIPDDISLDDVFTLPACYFETPVLRKLVINRKRKRDPSFVWPLKRPDVTKGVEDNVYLTAQEQRDEVTRRKEILQSHKRKRKKILDEIEQEVQKIERDVDAHVQSLYRRHIPQKKDGTPKLGKTHFATAKKNIVEAYRKYNKVTAAERRDVFNKEKSMTPSNRALSRKRRSEKEQVAFIRYRPEKEGHYIATFDVKQAKDSNVGSLINCKWVRSWLSVSHYRLALKLPDYWLHVPAGNSRLPDDCAPFTLLSGEKVKYPQGRKNLCLIKSLVSALYYMGLCEESGRMNNLSALYSDLPLTSSIAMLKDHMQTNVPQIGLSTSYNLPRCFGRGKRKKNSKKIDIQGLIRDKTPFPTVVIPIGKDKGVGHAVCVVDNLIFDSTQKFALRLSQESFGFVCGSEGCDGVYLAVRFARGYNTKTLRREMVLH